MRSAIHGALAASVLAGLACAATAQVWHPGQLNWDFKNFTGAVANDFEIIVADPNYNPDVNDPGQVYTGSLGFPRAQRSVGDFDPDHPGDEVKIRWSGRVVQPDEVIHVGLDTKGAGKIIGAQWSFESGPISYRVPIVFERTRVNPRGPTFDLTMELNFPVSFFDDINNPDYPNAIAGFTGIQTYQDIPEWMLSLEDLNSDLDLQLLENYRTDPRIGAFDGPPIEPDDIFELGDDSLFEVFVGATDFANPGFESLLYSQIVVVSGSQREVIGRFWNLNAQCPTPGTLVLLAASGLIAFRRHR